ncbi:hypothetical protein Ppa06_13990 [Planomonospora parontospora subsp. parontospora]|uniref:TFIIB-type zinc ribbon-containing protein n=2 Tax=Planomonospora parontospora TaxID=58119 RepID=A0AA37BD11_9ACTN|nr:hypothetical protein [Planomonospora parontospora]GGK53723.1 hypothetical protein GCM10010126_11580 [Planomonospora parontospora]GII07601.1 hypothetical protein Ppa06_13990 [Planomonospora parontospora subsp. parontospora]
MSAGSVRIGDRFRDPLVRVDRFADDVLVRCPACDGCAVVLGNLGGPEHAPKTGSGALGVRRRLRCGACGSSKDEFTSVSLTGGPVDPFFRLPLWLQADCRGHVLWAYNVRHLDLLESYVAARLRERRAVPGSMSMLARLPKWLKSAKNRDEVLRAVNRMRASLPRS